MKYVYPAIFTPVDDGQFDVYIPDLPHCRTCGNNLEDAIQMAEDASSMWLWDAENNNEKIPQASDTVNPAENLYVYASNSRISSKKVDESSV